MSSYRISQLADRTGFSPSTLRYYEQAGLLTAERTPGGYRSYSEADVRRLVSSRAPSSWDCRWTASGSITVRVRAPRGAGPFPYRWRSTADFGPSKFGCWLSCKVALASLPGAVDKYHARVLERLGYQAPRTPRGGRTPANLGVRTRIAAHCQARDITSGSARSAKAAANHARSRAPTGE